MTMYKVRSASRVVQPLLLLSMLSVMLSGCDKPVLHPEIAREYAPFLRKDELAPPRFCGKLVEVRLAPDKFADAEPSYFDNTTGKRVVVCDNPLSRHNIPVEQWTTCPPPEWRCGP